MKRLLFTLCFASVLIGAYNNKLSAQVHLRIDSLINFPDTAFIGQGYQVAIRVKNIGNQPYQGPLQIGLMRDSAFTYLYYSNNSSNVILPNDTLTLSTNGTFGFIFDSTIFRPGNNVVVVWPYSNQGQVLIDSLTTDVYVNFVTGIKNILFDGNITFFPNPFKDEIAFAGAAKKVIEHVRIFTLQGVVVYDEKVFTKNIKLDWLKSGCYLIDAQTREGKHLYRKIIKE